MLGLRWVSRFGDAKLQRAARDSVAKIGTVLPQGLKPYLYDSSLLVPAPFGDASDPVDESHLRTAIREERKLFLHYIDLGRSRDAPHHLADRACLLRPQAPSDWLVRNARGLP